MVADSMPREELVGLARARSAVRPHPAWAVVLGLSALALWVRLTGLQGPDGAMNTDEVRLAMAADGVLAHGLPVLPSGRLYTRGSLNSYLIAPAFALLGRHDFSARLPSVLAGALLVPVVFLLGRVLWPRSALPGLAAAGFVAMAEPLVYYSRSAWLPSIFLLLFTLAIYACYRGFVERRAGWQVAGGVAFLLALLSYEFAVLLLAGLGVLLVWCVLRGDRGWFLGWPTVVAGTLMVGGVVLLGASAVLLRNGTLAGPLGEVRMFVAPSWRLGGASFYWRMVLADYAPLCLAALVGLPLLARRAAAGVIFLVTIVLLCFLVPSFVIQSQRAVRYVLPLLPVLALLAGAAVAALAEWLGGRLARGPGLGQMAGALALAAVFGLPLRGDVDAAVRLFGQPPPGPTWVQAFQRERPSRTDLFVAESANKLQFYFGRAEYYLRPDNYERYAYRAPDAIRYIYTNSILLLEKGDFERLVEQPNPGRVVWIVGREDRLVEWTSLMDRELWPSLLARADRQVRTRDGVILLRLRLPVG